MTTKETTKQESPLITEAHYKKQVELWILNGLISHDALVDLSGKAYAHEQALDAETSHG